MFKINFLRNVQLSFLHKSFCKSTEATIIPRVPHTRSELYESLIMLQPNSPENSKTLKISVLGCPNSGKSTLVNMLTRWKVCAVSGKINTTRTKQTVVLTQDNVQLCFIDMPGVIGRRKGFNFKLEKSLIRDPHVGIFESDLSKVDSDEVTLVILVSPVICVVDVTHKSSYDELNIELLKALHFFRDKPSILVLNKIDRVDQKMRLFDMTKKLTGGVVNGKVCHIDRYANRFRNTTPTFPELIADDRMRMLFEKHRSLSLLDNLKMENSQAEISQDLGKVDCENNKQRNESYESIVAIESSKESINEDLKRNVNYEDIESKDVEDIEKVIANGGRFESMSSGDSNVNDEYGNPSRELEVKKEIGEIMKTLYPSENESHLITKDFENDDQIMDVLKAQLMLKTATKEQVKERCEMWRELSTYLNRTQETSWSHFDDVFAVSSATGHGIDRLRDYLIKRAKPGNWYFHSSMITDQEPEKLVHMSVWASCLNKLDKEIPYNLKIKVTNYEKSADGSLHILVTISCNRSRQLMALIGTKGCNISSIADHSREILQSCFKTDVYLKIVARRVGIAKEHLQRMRSVQDIKELYPRVGHT